MYHFQTAPAKQSPATTVLSLVRFWHLVIHGLLILICHWTHWLWFLVTHSLRLTRIQCTTNEPATFRTVGTQGQNHALSFPLFFKTNSCVHACKTSMLLFARHCPVCLKVVFNDTGNHGGDMLFHTAGVFGCFQSDVPAPACGYFVHRELVPCTFHLFVAC